MDIYCYAVDEEAASIYYAEANTVVDREANFAPTETWWSDNAASWGIDPASVRLVPLQSAHLREVWGDRYSVFMRRDETPARTSTRLLERDSYWRDREWDDYYAPSRDAASRSQPRELQPRSSQSRRTQLRRLSRNLVKLLDANGGEMLIIREEPESGEETGEEKEHA